MSIEDQWKFIQAWKLNFRATGSGVVMFFTGETGWLSSEKLRQLADELDRLNNTPNKETDA